MMIPPRFDPLPPPRPFLTEWWIMVIPGICPLDPLERIQYHSIEIISLNVDFKNAFVLTNSTASDVLLRRLMETPP